MSELSKYDESLSDVAKQGIKSAKENYNKAKSQNDTIGMAKANAYANSIRKMYGGYTGGDDGSAYYPISGHTQTQKPEYSSVYSPDINGLKKKILNREAFSFNLETDPMYKLYKKVYTQMGNDAYDRALSQNAIKTGGIVNTNAAASAMLAQSKYSEALADKAAEAYKNAYDRYQASVNSDFDTMEMLEGLEDSDYKKFKDTMEYYIDDRNFGYKKYTDSMSDYQDSIDKQVEFEYNRQNDENQLNYKKQSDAQKLAFDIAKLEADRENHRAQNETNRFNALARLAESVYDKSNIGVNLSMLMDLLNW